MMGTAQGELAAPVLKGTNAVLCLTSANPTPERPVCIRCSKCVEVCPMHLQPLYLYRYEAAGNLDASRPSTSPTASSAAAAPTPVPASSP